MIAASLLLTVSASMTGMAQTQEAETDRAPRVLSLANNRKGYVEPITIKPLCLACHGDNLAPDVATQIRVMYPEDEATGFKLDDLRGVYWVEYPAAEQASPLTETGEPNG